MGMVRKITSMIAIAGVIPLVAAAAQLRELEPFRVRIGELRDAMRPAIVSIETRFPRRMQGIRIGASSGEIGTGFIIDGDNGYIATAAMNLFNAQAIKVNTSDGKSYEGHIVGYDATTDVGVIRIMAENLTQVRFAERSEMKVGEPLLGLGFDDGLSYVPTLGLLSAMPTAGPWAEGGLSAFIVTDMAVSYGQQGMPVFNFRGQVVGMFTRIRVERRDFYINYLIPSDTVRRVAADLIKYGRFRRPWVGISVIPPDVPILDRTGYPYNYGLYITVVDAGSPAAQAGLMEGDFIMALNNRELRNTQDYWTPINQLNIGDSVSFKVWRLGTVFEKTVRIGEFTEVKQ
jgi:serine protease Do